MRGRLWEACADSETKVRMEKDTEECGVGVVWVRFDPKRELIRFFVGQSLVVEVRVDEVVCFFVIHGSFAHLPTSF